MQNIPEFQQYMLKEYIQCQILEYLSSSRYIGKLAFIGGTNLRLIKHIDRFSEDLDFDCKDLLEKEFLTMTDDVLRYLRYSGYKVEPKQGEHDALAAYRRSLYFPQFLFSLHLSGYRNARFLIKLEMKDQGFSYTPVPAFVQGCGFYFPIPVPPDDILCAMKLSAVLTRSKGRDFYDAMFLLGQTRPNYAFLAQKNGIHTYADLKKAVELRLTEIDLQQKRQDFEHVLFDRKRSEMILHFGRFIRDLDQAPI